MSLAKRSAAGLFVVLLLVLAAIAQAAISTTNKISDVRGTKHNLSAAADGSGTPSGGKVPVRTMKASSETQVCVFCHTPHEAESISFGSGTNKYNAPLWNRKLSGQTYTPYNSSSIDAADIDGSTTPDGSSKLCLSCHDGTMGVDKVNALNGAKNVNVAMTAGASPVKMPGNSNSGFTRNLGTDLTADHPISFTYDATLAANDGELRGPDGTIVGTRTAGTRPPKMPLEKGQMQCSTCHDPHLRDTATGNGNAKFLRMNRFQVAQPAGGNFSATNDIICLACHDKAGASWAYSAHANSNVATHLYKGAAAQQREFPSSLDTPANTDPPVWQVSCLNCHDTHTVQGARRLLREGTDSTSTPKTGGNSALEETCYQCHTTTAESAVVYTALTNSAIPDIKTDFTTSARHMPIKSTEQTAGVEVHDIGGIFNDSTEANCSKTTGKCGKDFLEARAKLGLSNLNNRHAECTDCHNPHRVIKGQSGLPGSLTATNTNEKAGTHRHENATGYTHSNIISGVLRGSWGVEPIYPSNSFQQMPSGFTVKRGDPGTSASTLVSSTYVTREYQICLKCHSNYGYTDDNVYPNGTVRPMLGGTNLTPQNPNGHSTFSRYTNQAKEFQAPSTHAVGVGTANLGFDGGAGTSAAATATNNRNHRSWHPVMAPTGRTGRAGNWLAPWNNAGALGNQTMYCSDCHGTATANGTAMPNNNTNTMEGGSPWGPHGSSNNFLLKGPYDNNTGVGQQGGLCFKCHNYNSYATGGGGTGWVTDKGDGHQVHRDRIKVGGSTNGIKCNWCHVGVPHGWKNRNFLVNLNDVGPEAGLPAGTSVTPANNVGYSNGPYYRNAFLKITSFAASGSWSDTNCNGGRDSMKNTCASPP
ncbi:hypothetical protein EGT07_15570 [Herbaspirillum sp. HC18]|nr:hypothetical protein EGT07_15570 [Herbaspirillum sp. HC18]